MEPIVIYILKSSGLIALFYVAYLVSLRNETFFTSNRWFLLSGLITSILLPLFFIKKIIMVEAPKVNLNELVAVPATLQTTSIEIPVESSVDWIVLLWIGYGCVVGFLLLKLVFSFISLFKLVNKEYVIQSGKFKLINLNKNNAPFSFFNYIVFNENLYSDKELESILLHEKIHSKEKHSLDILISQLFCAFFWFNPIVWLYKKAIVQNLEYIADQKATQQLEDKTSYQMALLKVVSHQNCLSITNNFYQSLIKKRIVMLNKNQSHKSKSWKYSLVLPFLIGFIFLFQIETKAQIRQQSTDSTSTSVESSSSSFSSIVTKSTTDSDLRELEKIFTSATEQLLISKVKRNNKGEITAIKLVFDTGKTYVTVMERKAKEAITDIKIYVKTDSNNKKEVGFEDVSEVKAVPVEVFDEFGISTIDNVDEKQTYWSMDNMKKDGKDVVLIINGKVKGATEKIKLPMTDELGEMKEITAAVFEKKYNQKADENKLYYEVETVKIKTVKGSWNEAAKSNKVIVGKYDKTDKASISKIDKLYIINGKEYLQSEIPKGTTLSLDGTFTELNSEEGVKRFGLKAKDGVLIFEGTATFVSKEENEIGKEKNNKELEKKKELEIKAQQNSSLSKTEINENLEKRKKLIEERKTKIEERKKEIEQKRN